MKKRKKVENNLIAANALKRKFWLYEGLHQQSAINLVARSNKKIKEFRPPQNLQQENSV